MLLLAAALLAAAAPSALLAAAQSLPDKGTCVATAASQQDNLNVLAPCVGGPTVRAGGRAGGRVACARVVARFGGVGGALPACAQDHNAGAAIIPCIGLCASGF